MPSSQTYAITRTDSPGIALWARNSRTNAVRSRKGVSSAVSFAGMGQDITLDVVTLRDMTGGRRWVKEPAPRVRYQEFGVQGWPCDGRNQHVFHILSGGVVGHSPDGRGELVMFPPVRGWDELPFHLGGTDSGRPIPEGVELDPEGGDPFAGNYGHHWLRLADFAEFRERGGWTQALPWEESLNGWQMLAWALDGFQGDAKSALEKHLPNKRGLLFLQELKIPEVPESEMRAAALRIVNTVGDEALAEKAQRLQDDWWGQHYCKVTSDYRLTETCSDILELEKVMRAFIDEPDVTDVIAVFSFWS